MFPKPLIIHKEKTKKITTVTVVWISDTNQNFENFIFEFLQELLLIWEPTSKTPFSVSFDIQTPGSWS